MFDYDILATGSTGNAVIINKEILIDCGVPMKLLRESGYIKCLKLVLLTHQHSDHFNPSTVKALHEERPSLRWGCCEWMVSHLLDAGVDKRVIDVLIADEEGICYGERSGYLSIEANSIPHDVPNCCWHISYGLDRLFYATDCGTLDGIVANNYSLYLIEANHTRSEIESRIKAKMSAGEFSYEYRAARNHLSQEQALDWLAKNMGSASEVVFLHQHKEKLEKEEI